MASDTQPIRLKEVQRAVDAVNEAEARDSLAALCLDVLSRQAEGRTVFAGKKFARARAEEHEVTEDAAETPAGNVLTILERGPESPLERALVAGFFVAGLADRLDDDDIDERVWRFVRHADWLELSTDYAVYVFVDTLAQDGAGRIYREVAQAVVDEAAGRDGDRPDVRARNAARLTALATSGTEEAKAALREVIGSTALDEPTRLLASTLAGDGAEVTAVPAHLEGQVGRAPRGPFVELVRWLTGWAMVDWLVRGLGYLLGVRRAAELRLKDRVVTVKTNVTLLGRVIREQEETWPVDAIDRAGRQVRYPMLHLLVGTLALSGGVLLGGLLLFDGVRSGELILIIVAAGLLSLGAGLDLVLDVVVPGTRRRVMVDLMQAKRAPLRLTRVSLEQADAFLLALRSVGARGSK